MPNLDLKELNNNSIDKTNEDVKKVILESLKETEEERNALFYTKDGKERSLKDFTDEEKSLARKIFEIIFGILMNRPEVKLYKAVHPETTALEFIYVDDQKMSEIIEKDEEIQEAIKEGKVQPVVKAVNPMEDLLTLKALEKVTKSPKEKVGFGVLKVNEDKTDLIEGGIKLLEEVMEEVLDKEENLEENSEEKTDLSFEDLVERLYVVALGRDSEPEGKKFWCDEVQSGRRTGSDCALGFLLSEEFINKGLTNDEFVEVLYKTYFDRASEAEGKAYWVNALNSGSMDRITVIRCFADSREWCDVCARYGVKSGAPTAKATVASSNATKFATRLYTECLGRDAEEDGLKYWSLALTNLEKTGTLAAKEFFYSDEFVGKNTTNEAYVKCLYRTFMGRDAEDDGLNYWVGQLEKGESRASVLEGFANSKEFTEICASYGIDR